MCKQKWLVAVEVVNNVFIVWLVEVFYRCKRVVPVAANKNLCGWCNLTNAFNTSACNCIPFFAVRLVGNFVQKFKADFAVLTITIISIIKSCCKMARKIFPEFIKTFLKFCAVKKSNFLFTSVKRKSCSLMKIKNHVQFIIFTPADCLRNSFVALFNWSSISSFNKVVINWQTNMIESPFFYCFEIFLFNKIVITFFGMIALRKPSSQIHTMHETVKSLHNISC